MRATFAGYYRPAAAEMKTIWDEGLIVLDANVLLNLYRYPKDASADLFSALSQVKTRLWVPHQVALEYQANRLSTISEQRTKFDEVRSVLAEALNGLRGNLGSLKLKRRHSLIAADDLIGKVQTVVDDFTAQLSVLEKKQPTVSDPDKIRDLIDELLNGQVGAPPRDQAALNKIYEDGKQRYADKRPPGFLDDKKGNHLYGGMVFRREYGDLIVWEQIIEKVKQLQPKGLLFITDDDKEDWWWVINSEGKKTIGPRPELVEEMHRRGNVALFYMYTSERFLSYAKEYLGTEVKPESIEQVREVRTQNKLTRYRQTRVLGRHATEIVYEWLKERHPEEKIIRESGFPDFTIHTRDGRSLGYEVQYIWDRAEMRRRTSRMHIGRLMERPQFRSSEITFVFIAGTDALVRPTVDSLLSARVPVSFIVGTVYVEGDRRIFHPVYATDSHHDEHAPTEAEDDADTTRS